jgi:FkbM family methyltransferase
MFMNFPELLKKRGIRIDGVLHLGAHIGQEAEVYAASGARRVVWVEANPELIETLRKNVSKFPGQSAHQAAVSDLDGLTVDFHLASNGESSSLLRMKTHQKHYPHIPQYASIPVKTTTVDTLLKSAGIPGGELGFLNMDIQGAELKALQGMSDYLPHVRQIYTEVNFEELYEGCCLFQELTVFLLTIGFSLTDLLPIEHGWGEALFVRI